jgi:hypothetical protein
MKMCGGSGGTAPRILEVCGQLLSPAAYLRERDQLTRWVGPRNEERNLSPVPGIERRFLGRAAVSLSVIKQLSK